MNHVPNRLFARLFISMLVAFFAIFLGNVSPTSTSASAAAGRCGSWQVVPSPAIAGRLNQVAVISHTNIWAVGDRSGNGGYPLNDGLVVHWNGTRWSIIPSPEPGNYNNYLDAVTALSPNNIWAVGAHQNAQGGYEKPMRNLIEHWNGTRWSVVPSPNAHGFFNGLLGVAALSANDIWAVGNYGTLQGIYKTLIEHWNGTNWSIVSSPSPGTYWNDVGGIAAFSSSNIWTVGSFSNGKGGARTLIEHWDGTQWSVVPSPSVGSFDNSLGSVEGIAPDNIWVVGAYWAAPGNLLYTLTEHWNGKQWSVVPSPSPTGDDALGGVATVASNNVWAVGSSSGGVIIEHWDGTKWSIVPAPGPYALVSVVALNAHDIWAVGEASGNLLVMHYC